MGVLADKNYAVDGPAKSGSPVEDAGKHPISCGVENHAFGDAGFRWPIHSSCGIDRK